MKTNLKKSSKNTPFLLVLFFISTLSFFSCSTEQAILKPLTFSDVEKEFKFAKPLTEKSKQTILKQFGNVQNYRDSIYQRKNTLNRKRTIVTGHPTEKDSTSLRVFRMNNEELKKAGIKVSKDSIRNKPTSSLINKVSAKIQSNYFVQIWDAKQNHLYILNIPDDDYILDYAEEMDCDLPYSCRAGSCATCCSKVVSGTIDCSEQDFYDDDQLEAGFFPMCVAYATSDCQILASQEDNLI